MKKAFKYMMAALALVAMTAAMPVEARNPKPGRQNSQSIIQPAKPGTGRMSADVKKIYERARKGEAKAQNALGVCYQRGTGVAKNDSLAYLWFSQAAKQKYPNALVNVATCVRRGIGVKKDSVMARDLYLNAMGNAMKQKNDTVVQELERMAKKDVFMARTLAYGYYNGKGGLKRNLGAAKQYLKYAIDNGDESAFYPYAKLSLRTGDHPSAQRYFGKAYANGVKDAGYWYGRYLITGEGGNRDVARGYELVYPYAEKGLTGAQVLLGQCLLEGKGVSADPKKAVGYFSKAAENGNTGAQWNLALCLAEGLGVEQDLNQAFYWMQHEAMHSSENRFKTWLDPKNGNVEKFAPYILFMQGLKALNDSNYSVAQSVSKALLKQKHTKDGKILEGLVLLDPSNPKRNIKKGLKALEPYTNDEIVAFYLAKMRLNGVLGEEGEIVQQGAAEMQKLADNGFGPALSEVGDMYAQGTAGYNASDQRAISYWIKADKKDGLSVRSAKALAEFYDRGLGGLKKNPDEARRLRNTYRADFTDAMLDLVPEYKGK